MDVLVVEDEEAIRSTVAEALRATGLLVAEAASAEEALAIGGPEGPRALVADLQLGGAMDGLALAAEGLKRWPGLGVVYATGHPEDFEGRLLGPAERYLVKPYTPAELLQALRRVMRR